MFRQSLGHDVPFIKWLGSSKWYSFLKPTFPVRYTRQILTINVLRAYKYDIAYCGVLND